MRPVPIPDELVPPWGERKVISPPDGDLLNEEIAPVEAIVSTDAETGQTMFTMATWHQEDHHHTVWVSETGVRCDECDYQGGNP